MEVMSLECWVILLVQEWDEKHALLLLQLSLNGAAGAQGAAQHLLSLEKAEGLKSRERSSPRRSGHGSV